MPGVTGEGVSLPPGFNTMAQPAVSTPVANTPSQTCSTSQPTTTHVTSATPTQVVTAPPTSQAPTSRATPVISLSDFPPLPGKDSANACPQDDSSSSSESSDVFYPSPLKRVAKGHMIKGRRSFWERSAAGATSSASFKGHVTGTDQSSARDVRGDSGNSLERFSEDSSSKVKEVKLPSKKYRLVKRYVSCSAGLWLWLVVWYKDTCMINSEKMYEA